MKNIFIFLVATLLLCVSCKEGFIYDDGDHVNLVSLGAMEKSLECEPSAGTCSFNVLTNCDYEAQIIKGEEWISFYNGGGTILPLTANDKVLNINYQANSAGPRIARVVLVADTRRDTIAIKQRGLYDERVWVEGDTKLDVPVSGGSYDVQIGYSNILRKDLQIYTLQEEFVTNIALDEYNVLHFEVFPNGTQNPRAAEVVLKYVNGWEQTITQSIHITQNWH
jgi:hypothetical protein